MRKLYTTAIILGLLFSACRKAKPPVVVEDEAVNTEMAPGLPPDPSLINGYIYSCIKLNGSSPNTYTTLSCFACFGDPARKLTTNFDPFFENSPNIIAKNLANVHVGELTLNDLYVLSHSSFSNQNPPFFYNYSTNLYYSLPTSANWVAEGNGSFRPINVTLPITYPIVQFPSYLNTISRTSTLTIHLNQVFPASCDSMVVALLDYGNNYGTVKRLAVRGDTIVQFTPSDMVIFGNSNNGYLQLQGYNYCHQVVNSKVYLYTLSGKYFKNFYLAP